MIMCYKLTILGQVSIVFIHCKKLSHEKSSDTYISETYGLRSSISPLLTSFCVEKCTIELFKKK